MAIVASCRHEGFAVTEAETGEEALRIAAEETPDLILLDANPAEDIRNTRRIRQVIQAGRVIDRAQLIPVRGKH